MDLCAAEVCAQLDYVWEKYYSTEESAKRGEAEQVNRKEGYEHPSSARRKAVHISVSLIKPHE